MSRPMLKSPRRPYQNHVLRVNAASSSTTQHDWPDPRRMDIGQKATILIGFYLLTYFILMFELFHLIPHHVDSLRIQSEDTVTADTLP